MFQNWTPVLGSRSALAMSRPELPSFRHVFVMLLLLQLMTMMAAGGGIIGEIITDE